MSEKKVVIFIVEGPSDEAALGTIMKEYFSSNEVQFIVVHGDITLKDCVSSATILKKINERIEGVKSRYRYSQDDFADRYDGKVGEFIEFILSPNIAVQGTYQKTWDYIEKELNSLKRHTNMHLIFG